MTGVVVAIFLGGIVVVAVSVAARREDRRFTLVGQNPDWLSRSTRRLNGVGCRDLDAESRRRSASSSASSRQP